MQEIPVQQLEVHAMTFVGRLAALCAVAFALTGATPAASLPSLLGRMRAASGSPYRVHLLSTTTLHANGTTETFIGESSGLRFQIRKCDGDLCTGTYFDGDRFYSININQTILPNSFHVETYMRGLRTVSSLAFLDPTFEDDGGSIDDGGIQEVGGRRYRVLEVSNVDAVPIRVYVDPSTALIAFVRDTAGNDVFAYRDYRRVGAFHLPFVVLHDGVMVERYDARSVSDAPFTAPSGLEPTILPDGTPMQTDPNDASPVGTCTLAHIRVKCLIDTGNSGLSMSLELAEQLQLKPVGVIEAAGLGNYATEVVRAGPLRVGNASFGDANYVVLHDIHAYGYDVVLGADVLANARVIVDGRGNTVKFSRRALENAGDSIPLAFDNFVPIANVRLGGLPADLAVDTGDQSNINLAFDFYKQHTDLFAATLERTVSGVGGNSVELIGTIPSISIGSFRLSSQAIGTTRTLKGTANGHIGAAFLRHFTVVFDYPGARMTLIPQPHDSDVSTATPLPPPPCGGKRRHQPNCSACDAFRSSDIC